MNEPLKRSVRVRCPVDHAFAVFTDRIDLWWPSSHRMLTDSRLRMEARVGGRFFERTNAGDEKKLGEVVRWEPPHRVTYTWYPGAISAPTEVDVSFTPDGDFTVVDVTHAEGDSRLGEAWNQRVVKFASAWTEVLPAFVNYLASAAKE